MSDRVWPGLPTGPNEHETRSGVERQDVASLQNELQEQRRIGNEQEHPFSQNRVPLERKPG